jgi:hypothetical protein
MLKIIIQLINFNKFFIHPYTSPASGILKTAAAALILFYAIFGPGLQAHAKADGGEKFGREVLIYYSAANGNDDYLNDVIELFGIFINHYGYNFTVQNLDEGIASDETRAKADIYLICQYEYEHKNAGALCDYLISAAGAKRVILLELPGSPVKQEKLIEKIGFKCHDFIKGALIKECKGDSGLTTGEAPLILPTNGDYYRISPIAERGDAKVHLYAAGDGTLECPLVASSDNGAIVFIGKLISIDDKFNRRWMVNPFKLAQIIFNGERRFIAPDPCVQSGNRAAFIHIDGDGFNYKTEYNDERYSGEIITDEIINHYKLPTTASLIVSEVHPDDYGNKHLEKKAAELMKAPHVEPATHSWYHPFKWQKVKLHTIEKYSEDTEETDQILEKKMFNPANKLTETNLEKEILRSSEYISALSGRKCRVMCWTGMCNPTPDALKLCEDNGIYNINGGDTRFDGDFKLYSNLRPHYNPSGGHIKFNARYVNEFIMTDHWCAPYDNYKKVIEGFKNTASPHILTPINIYYHFYSGTKRESLSALKEVYDYTIAQSPSFMTASQWIDRLRGFIGCKITAFTPPDIITPAADAKQFYETGTIKCLHAFKFDNNGELDNFRWDYDGYPMINPAAGVIGFNEINGSIYINTGSHKSGEILIIDKPPSGLYLKSLNGKIISAGYDTESDNIYNIEAVVNSSFKAVIANAKHPFYKIYYTNPKNETFQHAGALDTSKNELTFSGPFESGKIKLAVHYSTHFGNIKSFIYGGIKRLFYFLKNNPVIVIILLIYLYFTLQNRYSRKKQK